MNIRWTALSVAGMVWLCCVVGACEVSADEPAAGGKLILSAPLTHSDWVLKDNVPGLDDGLAGVRHMLDMCKAAGWSRIYWRCLDAGRSLYPSTLMDPMGPPEGDNYFDPKPEEVGKVGAQKNESILQKMQDRFHYGTIDSLAEAVRYGHEIGLEIHAWFSINEDDHAWGWPSRYTVAHPEHRWKRRDGSAYHSQLSFAYPEVREYKLAIIREVLDKYPVDGLFVDWIRTGDVRDPQVDASGVADYGYERILVDGFKTEFGVDPQSIPNNDLRWVEYRAEPQTEFMRLVRKLAKSKSPQLPVAVLVQHPWSYRGDNPKYADNLQGLLLDVETWADEGLMDAAVPAGYFAPHSGGTPELAYEHLKQLTGGKTDIWMYAWVPTTAEEIRAGLENARKLGAKQILYWEADYIDNHPHKVVQNMQHVKTPPVAGTKPWTRVSTVFQTGQVAELEINCRFGGWGVSTGQAWYDDVVLEQIADASTQLEAIVAIEVEAPSMTCSPMVFGGFIEHFHRQIYGGLFEPGSPLSDDQGIRQDVIEALRDLKLSIVRWPGGCFASGYHWKDGVGSTRRPVYDRVWGVDDPNTFGTDEFVEWCRRVGCIPYICSSIMWRFTSTGSLAGRTT